MSKVRILGVFAPGNKRILYALSCHVKGIGLSRAKRIISELNIDESLRLEDLGYEVIARIEGYVKHNFIIGADLSREVFNNIKLQKQIKSYIGLRHSRGLPVRGQKTKTNARTRKGKRKTVANKKK
ncbi:MAG: 30S ribosomal protein S13 [Chlamydiia bacterium]|nr:30S ribosomal protein S13 [Chlamydiia bacterium]